MMVLTLQSAFSICPRQGTTATRQPAMLEMATASTTSGYAHNALSHTQILAHWRTSFLDSTTTIVSINSDVGLIFSPEMRKYLFWVTSCGIFNSSNRLGARTEYSNKIKPNQTKTKPNQNQTKPNQTKTYPASQDWCQGKRGQILSTMLAVSWRCLRTRVQHAHSETACICNRMVNNERLCSCSHANTPGKKQS